MEIAYYWLIAGAVLFAFEVFAIPGVGFIFAGIGAILTGVLVKLGVAENIYAQFAVFFALTVASAIVLWKKLKSFRLKPGSPTYDNMVGTNATVHEGPLAPGATGQVLWSGAVMNAELIPEVTAAVPPGAQVRVVEVKGNTLHVKPK